TCKDVPALLSTFEGLPDGRKVNIIGKHLFYMDHTSAETISEWLRRETKSGRNIEVHPPRTARHPRLKPLFARFSAEVA
ncbi:SulP family inorganic anion transporter, partial [Rhizobium ruizarguesonis]